MKKLLALLLTLLLALSLCACEGGQTPPKGGDDVQAPATALCMTGEKIPSSRGPSRHSIRFFF